LCLACELDTSSLRTSRPVGPPSPLQRLPRPLLTDLLGGNSAELTGIVAGRRESGRGGASRGRPIEKSRKNRSGVWPISWLGRRDPAGQRAEVRLYG